jgi:hypothetical protein
LCLQRPCAEIEFSGHGLRRTPLLISGSAVDWALNVDDEAAPWQMLFGSTGNLSRTRCRSNKPSTMSSTILGGDFREELAAWMEEERTWPVDRTRDVR